MTFFKNAKLPVDSVSLKTPSRNLEDYLVLNLEVFPSGEPSFNMTGIIGVASVLSNQTFKPKNDFNTYTFIAENYNNFFPGKVFKLYTRDHSIRQICEILTLNEA